MPAGQYGMAFGIGCEADRRQRQVVRMFGVPTTQLVLCWQISTHHQHQIYSELARQEISQLRVPLPLTVSELGSFEAHSQNESDVSELSALAKSVHNFRKCFAVVARQLRSHCVHSQVGSVTQHEL